MRRSVKKRIKLYSFVLAICLVVSAAAVPDAVHAEVLHDTRKEEENERNTAEAYRRTAEILVENIQEVNDRIADTAKKIDELNKSVSKMDEQIDLAEKELLKYDEKIYEERRILSDSLQIMYETKGSDDLLSVILRANDEYDLLNRDEYTRAFSSYMTKRITRVQDVMDEQERKYTDLKHLREKKNDEIFECEKLQKQLTEEMSELTELVAEAKKKAEDAEMLAKALSEQVKELEEKERQLLGARKYRGENSNVIYDGDGTNYYYKNAYPHSSEDVKLLASIIQAEAGGYSYPGMVAVGSVIMNRVEDGRFPNTLEGVIYEPYQFEPVQIGTFAVIYAEGPVSQCCQAAEEVLSGKRNVPNFYFKADWYAAENGIQGVNIGGNVFH